MQLALKDSSREQQNKLPEEVPVLSFFTGAGLLDIGFEEAGFNVIWRNEYDLAIADGFDYAMGGVGPSVKQSAINSRSSVLELGPNQIARESFGKGKPPAVFGVIGGPPCPDFSVGGKNRGETGDHGRLTEVFVDRIVELQPTFFVLENVRGLFRTHKHRLFLERMEAKLRKHYSISVKVLNALEYGVPQDRERVFLVGFKRKWIKVHHGVLASNEDQWFTWPKPPYENAKTIYTWPSLGDTEGPNPPAGTPVELMVGPVILDPVVPRLPNGREGFRPKSPRFSSLIEGDVSRKSFKKLHRWRYSPTAAYGNNEVHVHPTQPRRLTVREAMRIQTIPDWYCLPPEMSLSKKFKAIGNGVPVRLAAELAKQIGAHLGGTVANL